MKSELVRQGFLVPTIVLLAVYSAGLAQLSDAEEKGSANYVAGKVVELNDNGAWSWFMDPRAIVGSLLLTHCQAGTHMLRPTM